MTAAAPSSSIQFRLNGELVTASGHSSHTSLLDFLRTRGLTGAKEGCAEGECGACAVAVVKDCGQGSAYRAVNSCLMFLPTAAGQEIYTVEGLAQNGQLIEAQQAMIQHGGSQCGYCTPGFVVSLFTEQYRPGRTGPCDLEELSGNLCRCTGYRPIRDAALSLGPAPKDAWSQRLTEPAPAPSPLNFQQGTETFHRPTSLADCLAYLAANPTARLIAGGTDLAVETNLRHRRFEHMVSLEAIPELNAFSEDDHQVTIGAALPLSELGRVWTTSPPVIREWLPLFASPLLRNRATIGGSLATASPIGDAAPVFLALDATLRLASAPGERTVPLAEFFTGYRETAMQPGELLVSIEIPKPFPQRARFYKVAKRRLDDISTVAACFALDIDSNNNITQARIAYGGVAPTPLRATAVEQALTGHPWNREAAATLLASTIQPLTDHRGTAAYRLAVAQSLLEKFAHDEEHPA